MHADFVDKSNYKKPGMHQSLTGAHTWFNNSYVISPITDVNKENYVLFINRCSTKSKISLYANTEKYFENYVCLINAQYFAV